MCNFNYSKELYINEKFLFCFQNYNLVTEYIIQFLELFFFCTEHLVPGKSFLFPARNISSWHGPGSTFGSLTNRQNYAFQLCKFTFQRFKFKLVLLFRQIRKLHIHKLYQLELYIYIYIYHTFAIANQQINISTYRHIVISTHQHINAFTHINISTY